MNVLVFGLAGSGKSSLISRMEGKKINLDPGVEYLPYNPDFDVRDVVKVKEIMEREKLGPNGSFLRAFEIIKEKVFIEDSERMTWIDMPGQFEIYLLFDFDFIKGEKIGLYLMDAKRDTDFKNFIIDNLLFTILSLKFDFPILRVFTKSDLLSEKEMEDLVYWSMGDFPEEGVEGLLFDLLGDLRGILTKFYSYQQPLFFSIYDKNSYEELEKFIFETKCTCGDMT